MSNVTSVSNLFFLLCLSPSLFLDYYLFVSSQLLGSLLIPRFFAFFNDVRGLLCGQVKHVLCREWATHRFFAWVKIITKMGSFNTKTNHQLCLETLPFIDQYFLLHEIGEPQRMDSLLTQGDLAIEKLGFLSKTLW